MISDRIVDELLAAIAAPSLAGRIELGDEVGRGGMGVVYRAVEVDGGRALAVKLMRRADQRDARRFAREAEVLEALDHRNVVGHIEHGVTGDGEAYLVMEWVDGVSLRSAIGSGPLALTEAVEIGRGLAAALAAAHELEVIHRDLKPSNVILAGDERRPVLLDFGVARRIAVDDTTLTDTGEVVGTPGYLSPEQIEGAEIDGRSDLFALGCVLYEMLAGARAFAGEEVIPVMVAALTTDPEPIASLRDEVSPRLAGLVDALLAKSPDDRPSSAGEVEAELRAIGAAIARNDLDELQQPTFALREEAPTRVERPAARRRGKRTRRLPVALALAALAVAATAVGGFALAAGDGLVAAIERSARPCERQRRDGCDLRCALGDIGACERAGEAMATGLGRPRDRSGAMPVLEYACDRGFGRACYRVAFELKTSDSQARAATFYERSCRLEFASACRALGNRAADSEPDRAKRWYAAGCDYQDAVACRRAGELEADAARAAAWFKRSCDLGHAQACSRVTPP